MLSHFCCVITYPVLVWLLTHVFYITSALYSLLLLILTSLFIFLSCCIHAESQRLRVQSPCANLSDIPRQGYLFYCTSHQCTLPYFGPISIHIALGGVKHPQASHFECFICTHDIRSRSPFLGASNPHVVVLITFLLNKSYSGSKYCFNVLLFQKDELTVNQVNYVKWCENNIYYRIASQLSNKPQST